MNLLAHVLVISWKDGVLTIVTKYGDPNTEETLYKIKKIIARN